MAFAYYIYTGPVASSPPGAPPLLSPEFAPLLERNLFEHLDLDVIMQHRVSIPGLGLTEFVDRSDREIDGTPPVSVRIHRPKVTQEDPSPCVLSIHGGGFMVGSYSMDDARFESWCGALGVIGISVDYRLAPETPYPGPLEDCYSALKWAIENSRELRIDPARLGVYGASAGGGLAAAMALLVRDRGEFSLAFQLLESPMLDDRQITPSSRLDGLAVWSKEANEFGWKCYLGDLFGQSNVPAYAAPARALDLSGLPPTFISVGTAEALRDEDIDYAMRLNQAGVPTELHVYPGAPHGYQMFVDSPVARQSQRDSDDWLARTISGQNTLLQPAPGTE
jgi:acetyl esterase/lipase